MKTAIMGFGNPVRSDDGVGIFVIDELKNKVVNKDRVSLFDMGTSAFEVLFKLKGHDKIIMIDAVKNSDEPPGTVFKVPSEEILSAPVDDPMVFLHGMKWNQALSYAKKIMQDEYPNHIIVYLIAVENTKLDVGLSEEVKNAGLKVLQHILTDLRSSQISTTH